MTSLSDETATTAAETDHTTGASAAAPDEPTSPLAPEAFAEPAPPSAPAGVEDVAAAEEAAQILAEAEAEAAEEEAEDAPVRPVFADLGLSEPVLRALEDSGYRHPTPIQEQAIPVVLMGRDVMGVAQTGTGKTAAFTLPMLDILSGSRAKARMPRSLILEPTRELALQVAENFVKYGKHLNLVHALLIGGESMGDQKEALAKGVDVLIATPGRLLDLFDRGNILLADTKLLVIDEADRMLDMGFIPDVEKIVSFLPKLRQTLFFSATMAPEIRRLADAFLSNPKTISVSRPATVAATITAGAVLVREHDKREALRRLIRQEDVQNALIFCNRKVDVDVLYKSLKRHGFSVGALHGDMDQSVRFATLNKFKAGETRLLVCSDVAARGLDIGGLSHVFNFDVPFHAEDYVHRIGRTGRAGREGHAYTIATPDDAKLLVAVEKLTGKPIARIAIDGLDPVSEEEMAAAAASKTGGRGRGPRGRGAADAKRGGTGAARRGGGRGRGERREAVPPAAATAEVAVPEAAPKPRRERGGGAEERRERDKARHAPSRGGAEERRAEPRRERDGEERRERRREEPPASRAAAPAQPPPPASPRQGREGERRHYGRGDDLGPAVRGFGDAVPAFMLIPIPRARRDAQQQQQQSAEDTEPEAEAA